MSDTIYGMGNEFVWWFGIVESRMDPEKLGRCKVRIIGHHTDDKDNISTNDLPWAYPIMPIVSGPATSGFGDSPLGAAEGSTVFGFYRDGHNSQEPIILGIVASKPVDGHPGESYTETHGFWDPRKSESELKDAPRLLSEIDFSRIEEGLGVRFKETHGEFSDFGAAPNGTGRADNNPFQVDESESPRLARNDPDKRDPILDSKAGSVDEMEPEQSYAAEYPYNRATKTESGHVFEVDDTPTHERIHTYHRTGTFEELRPDGGRVLKVVNNNYEIVIGEDSLHIYKGKTVKIEGGCDITINASQRDENNDYNLTVDKNANISISTLGGNINISSIGNTSVNASGGNLNLSTTEDEDGNVGDINMISGGNMNIAAEGDIQILSKGDINTRAAGTLLSHGESLAAISSEQDVDISAYTVDSSGNRNFRRVSLNNPEAEPFVPRDSVTGEDLSSLVSELDFTEGPYTGEQGPVDSSVFEGS